MSGRRSFDTLRSEVRSDAARSRRVDVQKVAMAAAVDIEGLRELRRARNLTQEQLAELWRTSQANVSRVEHTDDLFLSTLKGYIEAMGGRLRVAAVFEDAEFQFSPENFLRHARPA
jgi:predicted transcriptional regulator